MLTMKTVRIRLVEERDAEFILNLRLDEKYNNFLSKVEDDIEAQRKWIQKYKAEECEGKQYYFIIERNDGVSCGTVRIYDIRDDSFCWGSWILNHEKTRYAAIESALLVYKYGFEVLGFAKSHFDVMKMNTKVIDFHKKFGAKVVGEDSENYYFEITKIDVEQTVEKFEGILK